jgi:phosphoglycolate phosphatase-like HAD superfamily hydrolase
MSRRARVELDVPDDRAAAKKVLDVLVGNWPTLLERFAEDRAPLHLRPSAEVNGALRRLAADGIRLGAFTDAPEQLAKVAAAQLGVARLLETLEAGPGACERLLEQLGPDTRLVRSRAELAQAAR